MLFVSCGFERRGAWQVLQRNTGLSEASMLIDEKRIPIRNICLFLTLANACLWFFLSMDGTAFTYLSNEYDYYGHLTWTVITKLATPLEIFFRMHAAGCVFDIWSKM